jgi:two-component system response regulator GlrR
METHPGRQVRKGLGLEFLIGESPGFLDILARLPLFARSEATILLMGETGTGKELFARAIHYSSARHTGGFVPVNCGAVPEHLFENELFGHARGAYTGAITAEKGLIPVAHGGTLFLDEFDSFGAGAQVKLLRFLQDREYRPLGSAKLLHADVRVIAASNANLDERLASGALRKDLFHRLNVLSLAIPPLRERGDDAERIADSFLEKYASQYGRGRLAYGPAAKRKIAAYHWPGNIRELDSIVHRAVVLSTSSIVTAEDLDIPSCSSPEELRLSSFRAAKSRCVNDFECRYLRDVMDRHNGNVSRAAEASGKERRSFQRLLRKHGF